jgi:hypothetical protein
MKAKLGLVNTVVYILLQTGLLLTTIKPARAIPAAVTVPALCAGTGGIGCALVFTAVVGGVVHQIWQLQNGRYVSAILAVDAVKLGNAHWGADPNSCKSMEKRNNWRLLRVIPATTGGYWCIFEGKQTDFSDNN